MGDFFVQPPGFGEVPPEPDTPLPNFQTVGQAFGTGMSASGVLTGIWNGFLQACAAVLTWALAWLLKVAVQIAAWFINVLTSAEADASSGYGQLVANTINNVFGVQVDPSQVNTRIRGPNRQAVANQLGQALIGALFTNANTAAGASLPPSDAAANSYLAVITNMALNGWLETWVTDALSLHELQRFGELKDIFARVLGLGRMSRQVFAAPIKILVHDPYTALLNQKYRPKFAGEATIMRQYLQGNVSRQQLSTMLGNEGYSEQAIDWLIADHYKYLSPADVDYLISRGAWNQQQGLAYVAQQGYDTAGATRVLEILADKRIDRYRTEMCRVAEEAYVKGNIDDADLQSIVTGADLAQDEAPWFIKVAQLKRQLNITRISEAEIIKGIQDGILNIQDFRNWAALHNMPIDEEQFRELEIQFDINKQTAAAKAKAAAAAAKATAAQQKAQAAAAKATAEKALAADKGVSVAEAETLVKDGVWTFDKFAQFLTAKGYGADAISSIVQDLHGKVATTAAAAAAAAGVRAAAATKGLSLAEVEKAVTDGILQISDLQAWLTNHGFDAADSQVVVELTQRAIQDAQVKAAAKAAAGKTAAARSISLPDIERAVRLGLTPIATYTAALTKAGFDQMSIDLLTGILNAQIAADKATAAKRATATTAAGARAVTLAQMEAEIIAGIRPISDYTSTLAQLGYSVADQQSLTELLQLKVDQAKATAAKRAAAGTELSNRGISLADAHRAVLLGVVPLSTYQSMLTAAGFTQDAVDVLSNTLLAELAKAKKTQAAAVAAGATAAAKGISLPQLERAVIAGVRPIADYTQTLAALGYSAADQQTLTDLVQLKIDQGNAAAARHADAEGRATVRGISLAQEEAAVVAGDKTMADYDALLTALGYDEVDRATLESLLQAKVSAAAAKAAA